MAEPEAGRVEAPEELYDPHWRRTASAIAVVVRATPLGLRSPCLVAGAMQLVGLAVVTVLYHERQAPRSRSTPSRPPSGSQPPTPNPQPPRKATMREVLALPGFLFLMALLLCIQFVE